MLNTVLARRRFPESLRLAATTVLAFGVVLDSVGRLSRNAFIWRVGGHVLGAGILLAAITAIVLIARKPRRGVIPFLIVLLIGALARWLRGSAGVPPDNVLLAAEWICVGILLLSWRKNRAHPSHPSHPPQPREAGEV
jgi:hypothetical protein